MPICNKCHGALPEHCVCKEGISRYLHTQSDKAKKAEKTETLRQHALLNNALTPVEARAVLRALEGRYVNHSTPAPIRRAITKLRRACGQD